MSFEEIRAQALRFIGSSQRPYRSGDVIQVTEPLSLTADYIVNSYEIPVLSYRQAAYRLTDTDVLSVYGQSVSIPAVQWTTSAYDPWTEAAKKEAKVIPKVGRYKQFKLTKDGMSH